LAGLVMAGAGAAVPSAQAATARTHPAAAGPGCARRPGSTWDDEQLP
jgi:hypothetical protein